MLKIDFHNSLLPVLFIAIYSQTMASSGKKIMSYAQAAATPASKKEKPAIPQIALKEHIYRLTPYLSIYTCMPNIVQIPLFDFYYNRTNVLVKEKILTCHITKKPIRSSFSLLPTKVWILNQSTFILRPHWKYDLPATFAFKVQFINPNGICDEIWPNMWIVPRLVTKQQPASALTRYLVAKLCAKRLHMDAMDELVRYLGGPRYFDRIKGVESFKAKIDATTEYTTSKGVISNFIEDGFLADTITPVAYSVEGLLKLVQQGVMEIAIEDKTREQVVAFSADAFYHLYPDGKHTIMYHKFHTVEYMMRIRNNFIKLMKRYVN